MSLTLTQQTILKVLKKSKDGMTSIQVANRIGDGDVPHSIRARMNELRNLDKAYVGGIVINLDTGRKNYVYYYNAD